MILVCTPIPLSNIIVHCSSPDISFSEAGISRYSVSGPNLVPLLGTCQWTQPCVCCGWRPISRPPRLLWIIGSSHCNFFCAADFVYICYRPWHQRPAHQSGLFPYLACHYCIAYWDPIRILIDQLCKSGLLVPWQHPVYLKDLLWYPTEVYSFLLCYYFSIEEASCVDGPCFIRGQRMWASLLLDVSSLHSKSCRPHFQCLENCHSVDIR